jgi:hypothetical protein
MGKTASERVGAWLTAIESRWSLWTLISGSGLVASFALPAWAVRAAQIFADYAPLSWVVAGFIGVLLGVLTRLLWQAANRLRIRNLWDARSLDRGSLINPLDLTFERKRIVLDDFVLPSWTWIEGKTFIDCDLIGPANMYFNSTNMAQPIRPPKVDAVWLDPKAIFNNGFIFNNCIFRNCSFQRITMYASVENYRVWKDNPNLNWISIPPTDAHISDRQAIIEAKQVPAVQAPNAEPKLLEQPRPDTAEST